MNSPTRQGLQALNQRPLRLQNDDAAKVPAPFRQCMAPEPQSLTIAFKYR